MPQKKLKVPKTLPAEPAARKKVIVRIRKELRTSVQSQLKGVDRKLNAAATGTRAIDVYAKVGEHIKTGGHLKSR